MDDNLVNLNSSSLGILYFETALALLAFIPNTFFVIKGIYRVLTNHSTPERNIRLTEYAYFLNEVSLLCRFISCFAPERDALRIIPRISTYISMLLAIFILGEAFKLVVKVVPQWDQAKIIRLQVSLVSVVGFVTFARLVIYSNTIYPVYDPLTSWSIIGGIIGSIIFDIYIIWQTLVVSKTIRTLLPQKTSSSKQKSPSQKHNFNKDSFGLLLTRSDYQFTLCACFFSRILSAIAIAVDILILVLFFLKFQVVQNTVGAFNILMNVMIIVCVVVYESLDGVNIQKKIEQKPIDDAKEKAKQFIENWRKKTIPNATPNRNQHPSEQELKMTEKKITHQISAVDEERDITSNATCSIFQEDVSLMIQTIFPKSYTPDKLEALNIFKNSYPGIAVIEGQKDDLKRKHVEAKKLCEEAKALKNLIKQLKELAEIRTPPPIKIEEGRVSFEDLLEKGEIKQNNADALEIANAKYKKICCNIKSIMGDIEVLQQSIEAGRTSLNNDFERYWQEIKSRS